MLLDLELLPRQQQLTSLARHFYYTLPPAVVLTVLYGPFFTFLDAYKLAFLILVGSPAHSGQRQWG